MQKLPFLLNLTLTPVTEIQKQSKVFNWECFYEFPPLSFSSLGPHLLHSDPITWVRDCCVSDSQQGLLYNSRKHKTPLFQIYFSFPVFLSLVAGGSRHVKMIIFQK